MQTTPARPHLRLVASDGELLPPPAGNTLAERLLDFAGIEPGLRVIEFAFGPGRLGWRLLAAGCEVVSVDLAETAPDALPEEWLGAFDLAVTACALHQVADPARLIAGVAATLHPGGACTGIEPLNDDFDSPDVRASVARAGLTLFQLQQQTPSSALFWRAVVPALQSLTPPHLSLAA